MKQVQAQVLAELRCPTLWTSHYTAHLSLMVLEQVRLMALVQVQLLHLRQHHQETVVLWLLISHNLTKRKVGNLRRTGTIMTTSKPASPRYAKECKIARQSFAVPRILLFSEVKILLFKKMK